MRDTPASTHDVPAALARSAICVPAPTIASPSPSPSPQPDELIVRLRDVHTFVDSHRVGVFEGVLRYAEVADPQLTICSYSPTSADLRLTLRARE